MTAAEEELTENDDQAAGGSQEPLPPMEYNDDTSTMYRVLTCLRAV